MEVVFLCWIITALMLDGPFVYASTAPESQEKQRQLCISHSISNMSVPADIDACPPSTERMLVEKVQISEFEYNIWCKDQHDLPYHDGEDLDTEKAIHMIKEIELKQSCNGQLKCKIPDIPKYVPLEGDRNDEKLFYLTYIVFYSCRPYADERTINISENFKKSNATGQTTLVLQSVKPFSRNCTIRAKKGLIELRPLWITFDDIHHKECDSSFLVYLGPGDPETFNCKNTHNWDFKNMVYEWNDSMRFDIIGNGGLVWLELSVDKPYEIQCNTINQDFSFIKSTSTARPTTMTTKTTTTSKPVTATRFKSTTVSSRKNQTVTQDPPGNGGGSQYLIIGTSITAVVATLVAVALLVYICYIRQNSPYQRRKSTRRTQRQHQQEQQQQQQQQQNGLSQQQLKGRDSVQAYDEYTYVDDKDIKEVLSAQEDKHYYNGLPSQSSSSPPWTPVGNNRLASGDTGIYSLTYSSVKINNGNVNIGSGTYDHLGTKSYSDPASQCPQQLYDTAETSTGDYAHFKNPMEKHHPVLGNTYNG